VPIPILQAKAKCFARAFIEAVISASSEKSLNSLKTWA
jgi:hypothetical protein